MALAAEKELEHIGATCVDRGFNPRTEVTLPVSQEDPQSAEETLTLEIRKHDDVRVS